MKRNACVAVWVAVLTLVSVPAFAARLDVATRTTAAGAGATVVPGFGPTLFPWVGDFALTVQSEVRELSGTFTYFYQLFGSTSSDAIVAFNLFGAWGAGGSAALNWGEVIGEKGGNVELATMTFGTTMTASLDNDTGVPPPTGGGLDVGEAVTFYAQSTIDPGVFNGFALDSGQTAGQAFAPAPEPGSLLLFASGLFGVAEVVRRRRAVRA